MRGLLYGEVFMPSALVASDMVGAVTLVISKS